MKQKPIVLIALAAALLATVTACKKDPVDPFEPYPPQQQLPNPLPAKALVKKLIWSENDYDTFTYNGQNQVQKLHTQWQFVEGDPTQIKSIDYDFEYDDQNRPVQTKMSYGFAIKFFYKDNLVTKTQEVKPNGTVASEIDYVYNNRRLIQEKWRIINQPGERDDVYRYDISYDDSGNLNKIATYEQDSSLNYNLIQTTEYSDFDNKINPISWMLRNPHLPQMRLQYNNPGKEVRRTGGSAPEIVTHEYQYNAQGLPILRKSAGPGGNLTMEYHY